MAKGPIVTVDADVLRYRVGFASQEVRYKVTHAPSGIVAYTKKKGDITDMIATDPEAYTVKRQVAPAEISHAFRSMKLQLEHIKKESKARELRLILSGRDNFRVRAAKFIPYKASRTYGEARRLLEEDPRWSHYFETISPPPGQPKPKLYNELTQYLTTYWNAEVIDGMEADDELTIRQARAWKWSQDKDKLREAGHIVATIDKDLQQVPGWFYDFRPDDQRSKDRPKWKFVTPEEAKLNLWRQVITGDMTDGIYGVDGMGPVKAAKALGDDPSKYKEAVTKVYQDWFEKMAHEEGLNPMHRYLLANYSPEEYMQEVYDLIYLFSEKEELDEIEARLKEV